MLCITSPVLTYNRRFTAFEHLYQLTCPLWQPLIWSLFLWICFFRFHMWVYTVFVFLWLISLNMCLVAQSCPTLCDLMDCSLLGSFVYGIFQARNWSGLPFPLPGDLPDSEFKPVSPMFPALWMGSLSTERRGSPLLSIMPSRSIHIIASFLNWESVGLCFPKGCCVQFQKLCLLEKVLCSQEVWETLPPLLLLVPKLAP